MNLEYGRFFLTDENQLCEDINSTSVYDLEACKDAVTELQKRMLVSFKNVEVDAEYPKGCYFDPSGVQSANLYENKIVNFNQHQTGSRNMLVRQVCKKLGKELNHSCTPVYVPIIQINRCMKMTLMAIPSINFYRRL